MPKIIWIITEIRISIEIPNETIASIQNWSHLLLSDLKHINEIEEENKQHNKKIRAITQIKGLSKFVSIESIIRIIIEKIKSKQRKDIPSIEEYLAIFSFMLPSTQYCFFILHSLTT